MQAEKSSVLYLNSQAQGNKYFQKPLGAGKPVLKVSQRMMAGMLMLCVFLFQLRFFINEQDTWSWALLHVLQMWKWGCNCLGINGIVGAQAQKQEAHRKVELSFLPCQCVKQLSVPSSNFCLGPKKFLAFNKN